VKYAQKLLETFPVGSPLREEGKVFFVNSGSEANDLALRMARVYGSSSSRKSSSSSRSGSRSSSKRGGKEGGREGGREGGAMDTIVLAGAYHGHTASLIEVSPYKYEGRGGFEPPGYIHKVSAPDVYRGKYRLSDAADRAAAAAAVAPSGREDGAAAAAHPPPPPPSPAAATTTITITTTTTAAAAAAAAAAATAAAAAAIGKQYAEEVRQVCLRLTQEGRPLGAFIAESILGCGGQV